MKNILIVSPSTIYGGGETYLLQLNNVLKEIGCNVDFVVSNERLFKQLDNSNKKLIIAKNHHIAAVKILLKINSILKKGKYDFVILNGLSEIGIFSRFIKHPKIIAISHINEDWLSSKFYERGFLHAFKRVIGYNFSHYIYRLIALNNITLENTRGYNTLFDKTIKLYTGISKLNINRKTISEEIIFGRISRMISIKGNDNLIRAFCNVHKKYPSTKLILAGDGEQKAVLEQLVNELDLKNSVSFLGDVKDPEYFYSKIDCMVVPSLLEAFPMVILEAMSANIPIITTNVGGITEMLENGDSARIILPNNIDEIENALEEYINNPELYESFSDNAYSRYENNFSDNAFKERWKSLMLD